VDIDRDLALIPSVAIHLNRNTNEGQSFNLAVDTLPLLGSGNAAGRFDQVLEEAAGGKIMGCDLYLYVRQQASVWGLDEEFISAPALDNLLCVWGCVQGFLKAGNSGSISVLTVFDSEEVGSNSPQGADSTMLSGVLCRISRCLGLDHDRMLANSMMISADMAHAIHPNHPELADTTNAPVMNGGVVLKFNASKNYTTTGLTAALFRKVCGKANVPLQTYYNRADVKGGATLGYISLNHVSVPSLDIGLAQLSMHSCYETAGVEDPFHLENAMAAYYSSTLETDGENYILK
jgi:aspartyl aminopeptidase